MNAVDGEEAKAGKRAGIFEVCKGKFSIQLSTRQKSNYLSPYSFSCAILESELRIMTKVASGRILFLPIVAVFSLLMLECSSSIENPYTNPKNLSADLLITNSNAMRRVGDTITVRLKVSLPNLIDSVEIFWGDKTQVRLSVAALGDSGKLTVTHRYDLPDTYAVSGLLYVVDKSQKAVIPATIAISGLSPLLSPITDTVRAVKEGKSAGFSFPEPSRLPGFGSTDKTASDRRSNLR